jgi:hypothetical protein
MAVKLPHLAERLSWRPWGVSVDVRICGVLIAPPQLDWLKEHDIKVQASSVQYSLVR